MRRLPLALLLLASLAAAPSATTAADSSSVTVHMDGSIAHVFDVTLGDVDAFDITMTPERNWGLSLVLWDAETGEATDARWSSSGVGYRQYAAEIEGHELESGHAYILEATGVGDLWIAGADVTNRTGDYEQSDMITWTWELDLGDTPSVIAAGGGYNIGTGVPIPAAAYVVSNAIVTSPEVGSAALADSYACFVSKTSTCEETKASMTSLTIGGVQEFAVASKTAYIGGPGGQGVDQLGEHYAPARLNSRFMSIWFTFPRWAPALITD